MEIEKIEPPRTFDVMGITIQHSANIRLEPDEQVTFVDSSDHQYDLVRKNWGYYATPSLNSRLKQNGLHAALIYNRFGKLFLVLVEEGKENEFQKYIDSEQQQVICWLDNDERVEKLHNVLLKSGLKRQDETL